MRRLVLASALALSTGGCTLVDAETPPGASYAINCTALHLELCFARAKELCPRGYEVVSMRRGTDPIAIAIAPDRIVVRCTG
jgi:hypothetical protein